MAGCILLAHMQGARERASDEPAPGLDVACAHKAVYIVQSHTRDKFICHCGPDPFACGDH